MNPLHNTIIGYIRAASKQALPLDDEQMIRRMFSNYRASQGLRLTRFGLTVMRAFFRSYEFAVTEDIRPCQLMFFDRHARLPYYIDKHDLVVFDDVLGLKLRLIDGQLSILLAIGMT